MGCCQGDNTDDFSVKEVLETLAIFAIVALAAWKMLDLVEAIL